MFGTHCKTLGLAEGIKRFRRTLNKQKLWSKYNHSRTEPHTASKMSQCIPSVLAGENFSVTWLGSLIHSRAELFHSPVTLSTFGGLPLDYTSFLSFEASSSFLPLASWILKQTAHLASLSNTIISWSNNQMRAWLKFSGTPVTGLFLRFCHRTAGNQVSTREIRRPTGVVGSRAASKPESWHPTLSTQPSKNNSNRVTIKARQMRHSPFDAKFKGHQKSQ